MAVPRIVEQLAARQCQHRAHPLAAARDQVTRKLGDQRHFGLHPVENDRIHLVHVGGDERHHRVERGRPRSEEHTSELQSLMRISYAVFCLKKTIKTTSIMLHHHYKNTTNDTL